VKDTRKVFRNTTLASRTRTNNNNKHNKNLRQGTEATNPQKTPKSAEALYPLCLCLCLSVSLSQNKRLGTPPTQLQRKLRETERWVGGGRKKKKKKKKKRKEEERKTQGFNGGCSYTKTGCCCCSSSTHERVPAATTGI
jgi:hypothetical protein